MRLTAYGWLGPDELSVRGHPSRLVKMMLVLALVLLV